MVGGTGKARVIEAERSQLGCGMINLDADLPADVKPASLKERERKRARESEPMKEWRARMAGETSDAVMKKRERIEPVNAYIKSHGLASLEVRGLDKVQAVALLQAIAYNLVTALRLRAANAAAA